MSTRQRLFESKAEKCAKLTTKFSQFRACLLDTDPIVEPKVCSTDADCKQLSGKKCIQGQCTHPGDPTPAQKNEAFRQQRR